ncbi:hypothetical protein RHSIM_RhsimUnG0060200 [Rhododendron simsii]|uniref:Uncharacterized protein n=1 Tax=Rhododendron simsii TaxID=118357 RepID=A0A834FWH9_RHOSS|nr:hypothetical protein RHSIM_RhsimUnG0060200 [Rhododendron simsii]
MIAVVILVAAVISTAYAGCTLPLGTNGSHEVLSPGHQSSIPSDVLATPPSVTADRAPLDVVDSGGQDDDSCGGADYQATAAGIHRNDCIAEFPPYHVDVPAVTGEISCSTDQIRTEERVEDNDEKDSFKFGNTMAPMVSSFQPRASLIGWMMLQRGHRTAANFFRHAGYFSGLISDMSLHWRPGARRHIGCGMGVSHVTLMDDGGSLGSWAVVLAGGWSGAGADFSGLRGGDPMVAGLGHKIPKAT